MVIDLNADLGEAFGAWSMGDDQAMLDVVSSANVACGFHAGDPVVARATCTAAARSGVVVGAHVGYRDLAGFGRRYLDVEPARLTDEVVYQVGALQAIAAVSGTTVRYIKPHGALYHAIGSDQGQASAVVTALTEVDPSLALVALPGSLVARLAEARGVRVVLEAFADRAYTPDGGLVPREAPGAVLSDPEAIARRV
ncbi:MAG TPA: 5-oxoprolinase subunit PxpA, partial [Actinotalea sp.]|nr:5-oxoprolinase subunit PxpA [Actinotalea sp.]